MEIGTLGGKPIDLQVGSTALFVVAVSLLTSVILAVVGVAVVIVLSSA
jgi:hypothetical protein